MRWSLQRQLLLPLMAVLVLAIGLTSVASAYRSIAAARRNQIEQLRRAAGTLATATFPLTRPVLESIRSLTGAEYIVLSAEQGVVAATIEPPPPTLAALQRQEVVAQLSDLSQQPVVSIGPQEYFAARIRRQRASADGRESVLVLVPRNGAWAEARWAAWPPLAAGSIALVASLAITAGISRRMARRIRGLGQQAERIAGGDFRPMPAAKLNDEMSDLGNAINRMARRLEEHTEQVRRHERVRTLDLLSGGMAHQLRNSVMGARMAIELHQRECTSGDESMDVALAQLKLMQSYLERFLSLGKSDTAERRPVEMGEFLTNLLELIRPSCRHAGVELRFAGEREKTWLEADPDLLQQMLLNLLLNALDAARARGSAGRLEVEYGGQDNGVTILIGDSGAGPAAEIQENMFEPFVSNKHDGTGLGLAVAHQIAATHGGNITWRRGDDMTWFTVQLPREAIESSSQAGGGQDDEAVAAA